MMDPDEDGEWGSESGKIVDLADPGHFYIEFNIKNGPFEFLY